MSQNQLDSHWRYTVQTLKKNSVTVRNKTDNQSSGINYTYPRISAFRSACMYFHSFQCRSFRLSP